MFVKNVLRHKFLLSLTSLALFAPSAHAVESVQLEHVPIDASLGCDRVFFKSSQNFEGTIYALPDVVPGINEYGELILSAVEDETQPGTGSYLFNFQIYFPNDDKSQRDHTPPEVAALLHKCDFDVVKHFLNEGAPASEQIKTIAYMPLTSIEVTIPEFLGDTNAFRIGQKSDLADADLIDYQDKTFNVVMKMNEEQKKAMLSAFTRPEGLQAHIQLRFKAHRQNGALKIDIDMTDLATSFKAQLKGEAYVVQADIKAALEFALSLQKQKIQIQEGTSESFNDLTKQILDKVIAELALVRDGIKTDDGSDPAAADPEKKKFSVAAAIEIIGKKINSHFEVVNSTAEEVATAVAYVRLAGNLSDPNIRVMRVASAETLFPTLSEPFNAGEKFAITGSHYNLESYEYEYIYTPITMASLRGNYVEVGGIADLLKSKDFKVENVTRSSGVLMAVGTWNSWWIGDWWQEYTWELREAKAVLTHNPRVNMDNDRLSYQRFPIFATFSQVGGGHRMFSFDELIEGNEYWSGSFNQTTGSIEITAKQDLGLMTLIPRFKLHENNDRMDFDPALDATCAAIPHAKNRNVKMDCYLRELYSCKPYEYVIGADGAPIPPTQEQKDCWAIDFENTSAMVEGVVEHHSKFFGGLQPDKVYEIRTDNKLKYRQRTAYYNITMPKYFKKDTDQAGQ